jgi:hypothetical protein
MPRFVVLRHETPTGYSRPSHYDLMLEQGEMLRTWALENLPTADQPVLAERLPDHRNVYLEYEGAVSGERGSVTRVDHGEYSIVEELPDRLTIEIAGKNLRGMLTIAAEPDSQRCRVGLSAG